MKDSTRIALINKEIETYRKLAVALESLKPTIYAFDGKCVNKKFAEAMDEFLKYGKEERCYYVSAGIGTTTYGSMFDMSICCYDDRVSAESDDIVGYCGNYYISNKNLLLRVKAEEVTTATANGKPRLNAKALVEKLDEKIQYLHNQAETLEKDLSHVAEMKADLAQIKQLMSVFNGKYHGRVAEVFNCNYFLKDNNGIQYR